jgi:hypothetical protein
MMRMDAAIARHAMTQAPKASMKDFMPWPMEDEPEGDEALVSAFKSLDARIKQNGKQSQSRKPDA